MKKYLFILAGVAFFSLLTSSSAFAVDTYPSLDVSHVDLESVDGFSRVASRRGETNLFLSCYQSRVGEIDLFPLTPRDNGQGGVNFSASPCGYQVVNSSLVEPNPMNNSYNYRVRFLSTGREIDYGQSYNSIRNSLTRPTIYPASRYVSAFDSLTTGYGLGGSNNYGLIMPIGSEDGYAYLVLTLYNIEGYNSSAVAPLLSESTLENIYVDSGSVLPEEIANVVNGSAIAGYVWTDSNNEKHTSLTECDSADSNCVRVIPQDEQFDAIENYLKILDDGTNFAIYAFPIYENAGYHITSLSFSTPSNMGLYGITFNKLNGNEEAYWGIPWVYSMTYSSYNSVQGEFNVLFEESYATTMSYLYLFPTTPEAFARSRSFTGQLVASHSNSLRYQNGLSQIEPNPGNNMWGNIFNLGNLIFPFQSFLTGFTNQQCVSIPIIGSWLGLGANQQYCSWWSADIRNVLTPIFSASSMMLLFGFIIHWLRKDNTDSISYAEGK